MRASSFLTLSLLWPLICAAQSDPNAKTVEPATSQTFFMPSGNMEPTLRFKEILVVSVLGARRQPLRHGDIVAYDVERHSTDPLIKSADKEVIYVMRVVGLAGDKISVIRGLTVRNGQPANEPYVDLNGVDKLPDSSNEVLVPAGYVYVLGDKRGNSYDSRFSGPISLQKIRGVVTLAAASPSAALRSVELDRTK